MITNLQFNIFYCFDNGKTVKQKYLIKEKIMTNRNYNERRWFTPNKRAKG